MSDQEDGENLWFDPTAPLLGDSDQKLGGPLHSLYPEFDVNDTASSMYRLNECVGEIQRLSSELFEKEKWTREGDRMAWEEKRAVLSHKRFVALNMVKEILETLQNPQIKKWCLENKNQTIRKKYKRIVKMFLSDGEYKKFRGIIRKSTGDETDYLVKLAILEKTKRFERAKSTSCLPTLNLKIEPERGENGEQELLDTDAYFEVLSQMKSSTKKKMRDRTVSVTDFDVLAGETDREISRQDLRDIKEFQRDMDDLEESYVEFERKLGPISRMLENVRDVRMENTKRNTKRAIVHMKKANTVQSGNTKIIFCTLFLVVLYVG